MMEWIIGGIIAVIATFAACLTIGLIRDAKPGR